MESSLCRLCVPKAFDGRAGLDMDNNYVFPQCVLVAITLTVDGDPGRGARASTGHEVGLLLCSVAITALSEVGV